MGILTAPGILHSSARSGSSKSGLSRQDSVVDFARRATYIGLHHAVADGKDLQSAITDSLRQRGLGNRFDRQA